MLPVVVEFVYACVESGVWAGVEWGVDWEVEEVVVEEVALAEGAIWVGGGR